MTLQKYIHFQDVTGTESNVSGVKFISELLQSTNSAIETRPLCLIKCATDSSSSLVMYMNLPRSSMTPTSNS